MRINRSITKAKSLRSDGLSFRDVAKKLKLPLSTVHLWTRDVFIAPEKKEQLRQRHLKTMQAGRKHALLIKRAKRETFTKKLIQSGNNKIGKLSKRELCLIGAALYWAEGFKKDNRLGFANSDPNMIILVLKWLIEVEKVPSTQIRLRVGLNESQKSRIKSIESKWSEITQIPLSQFQKPFYQKTKWKKTYTNSELYLGVLRIRANAQPALFIKIKGMIEGLSRAKQ